MNHVLLQEAIKLNKERKRKKHWGQFVRFLAGIVVFCTTYALILPAITLEKPTICGMEEHEHVETCFETKYETQLQCPYENGELTLHVHEDACYVQEQSLVCSLPETKPHEHIESCSTEQNVLVCTLEETEGHAHGETCYPESSELTCTLPETEVHVHGESCSAEDGTLICTLEETEGHAHDENCYTTVVSSEPDCGLTECEAHMHDETCYELQTVITCTLTEDVIHTHEESCYELKDKLICELPTDHFHGEECYVEVELEEELLVCELPIHIHEQACYPPETEEEAMEDSLQAGFLCGLGIHEHKETCYDEEGILTCSIPEHAHTAECVVEDYDETADIETQEDWEATFADIELTGNWPEDVLKIAESQLDYKESVKNCILDEDGEIRGYTRYGEWYGYPYGDWCAMFVSFCMHYAEVENIPLEASVNQWIKLLEEAEMYRQAEEYLPKPGDIIFFDWEVEEGTEIDADHVGLVAELIPATEESPAQIKTLEGNSSDVVQYVTYEMDDPVIIGYGEMPVGPPLEIETEKNLVYTDDTMRVDMLVACEDGLPEDLSLQVTTITEENNPEAYGAMYVALGEQMYDSPYYVEAASFYQMELYSEGVLYQLPDNATSDVKVTFAEPVFSPETVAGAAKLQTFTLIEEEIEIEKVEEVEEITEDNNIEETEFVEEIVEEIVEEPITEDIPEEEILEPDADATMLFSMKNTSVMAANAYEGEEQTIEDTESENENPVLPEFQAVELQNDGYDNADSGITGLSFRSNSAMTFAVAVASEPVQADYWKRVTSKEELTSDGVYMIVSAEGNYALNGNAGAVQVAVEMVKGNPGYYTISDDEDTNLRWKITPNESYYRVQNQKSNSYIYLNGSVLSSSSYNVDIKYREKESCWTINISVQEGWGWWTQTVNYYLNYSVNNSVFETTSSNDEHEQSLQIFKLINTTLNIPEDVVEGSASSSTTEIPDKPYYKPYIEVSEGKSDVTKEGNVEGIYYSDPATSKLESLFSNNQADDGKVLSDKSVIYGDDDYSAFENYDPNTFGVTLSALGQEYLISEQQEITTPIDVVFVLDVSGSMQNVVRGISRADAMVNAVNDAIDNIQNKNENNRVGVVVYSSGTMDVMELGRYTQSNKKYLKTEVLNEKDSDSALNGRYRVLPNSGLYNQSGNLVTANTELTADFMQANGTYTQAGIAKGAAMLERADNKIHTVVVNEGTETEQTFNIKRQPVIILLSDGEPSHCTSNFMDVLSGPHYGDGQVNESNYQGIMGYYTILSANYYKRIIGIAYDMPALFYTVGMGIAETGDTDLAGNGVDSDVYKRAVLNPTKTNIENLSSTINPQNTVNQLKSLMMNEFTNPTVSVTVGNQDSFMPDWLGQVHEKVPVMKNPYINNYSYADEAFFGQLGETELDEIFNKIIVSSQKVNSYGFILQSRSSVEITDPVGKGMEVKGAPILRYGGINYVHTSTTTMGNKTSYTYNYQYNSTDGSRQYADLSIIKVEIVTDENGLQTVNMIVPDHVLPAYSPYPFLDMEDKIPFYYESLPIRLIYQVGLTETAKEEIAALEGIGGTLTYYTNRYEDIMANTTLKPTNKNPFYAVNNQNNHDHGVEKTNNLTETDGYSFECHHGKVVYGGEEVPLITQELGNNGKLVFTVIRSKIDIPIEKRWDESVASERQGTVVVNLYQVVDTTVTLVDTQNINAETEWRATFKDLDPLETGYYAVQEEYMEGFVAIYQGTTKNIIIDGKAITVVPISAEKPGIAEKVVITNTTAYELPETGGVGREKIKFGGMLVIAFTLIYGYTQKKKRRNAYTGPP